MKLAIVTALLALTVSTSAQGILGPTVNQPPAPRVYPEPYRAPSTGPIVVQPYHRTAPNNTQIV